ncbi:MAG: thiolase family protein, partial [Pseudomonadota bacterium]
MSDVYIVGAGIHPFGRTEGRDGMDQGVFAVKQALSDTNIDWKDIEFAFGGSAASGAADTMVSKLVLTGIQFINVSNGCATGGSALNAAASSIKSGEYDIGMAVGFDKHPRGAFNADPASYGLPNWYGEAGYMLTTQFFGAKIMRYMHENNLSNETLGRVAEKAFRNGAKT